MMLDLFLRWFHILAAIILVGGTFYQRFALVPALMSNNSGSADLAEACRGRWAKWVMASSGLLLVTGLINAVRTIIGYEFEGGIYHGLVAAKLVIALGIFWISAVLAGRSSLAQKFREKIVFWLTVNVALSILIVCLAGYMRMEQRVEKVEEPITAQQTIT